MTHSIYTPYRSYDAMRTYVETGKTGVTRPLYDRGLSARILNPDDPNSDVTVNYRWRHLILDDKGVKSTRWGRQYIKDGLLDKERSDWGEILEFSPELEEHKRNDYRFPIAVYKSNNTVELNWRRRSGWAIPRIHETISGVEGIRKYKGLVKVRQQGDGLKPSKRKQICKSCKGEKYYVFTCWNGTGPNDDDLEVLQNNFAYPFGRAICNLPSDHKTSHVAKVSCYKCGGTGGAQVTPARWDSYVWDTDEDLAIDLHTKKIIGLVNKGGINDIRSPRHSNFNDGR